MRYRRQRLMENLGLPPLSQGTIRRQAGGATGAARNPRIAAGRAV
ncbi:hypothetical protein [Thermopirellula anaerolimosa]